MSRKDNTCVDVNETNFSQTSYNNLNRFACFFNSIYRTQFLEFQTSIVLGNDTCIGSHVTSDTSGVECTQSQLSTRFTDRLGSDYADSFTFLNHTARCQVTSVTFGTYTLLGFTSQY